MRGRKPKPTKLRLIEGKRGHRPINTQEPKPEDTTPPKPKFLDETASRRWTYYVKELRQMGTLAHSDSGIIAAASNAFSRWAKAELQLKKLATKPEHYPEVIKTKSGNYIQNPIVGIANAARDAVAKYEAEMGLNPTSRSRLKVETFEPMSRREWLLE